ncbi:MAG: transposase [Planctomycetaceae bacterium]|nr:transposase [Planctomycetaceae bacterium]
MTVMTRTLLEHVFSPDQLNAIFNENRQTQQNRQWLLSSAVGLTLLVVCKICPSLPIYQSHVESTIDSLSSLYEKLNGIDLSVSESLVRETASKTRQVIATFPNRGCNTISGYRSRIVDSSKIAATDRCFKALRKQGVDPLPGFGLVVYEPEYQLITDVVLCEDSHAQERSLFPRLLELTEANDLWIVDQNFCCWGYLSGIAQKSGYFLIRQHAFTRWIPTTELENKGKIETGNVFEQQGYLESPETGEQLPIRRVEVQIKTPTRDGDTVMELFSNLPETVSATEIANAYRKRWWIETTFRELDKLLADEIQILAYPPAALFALCMAFVAYNIMQCITLSIETVQPKQSLKLSTYCIGHEIASCYYGLDIVTESHEWEWAANMKSEEIGLFLSPLAKSVKYKNFAKRPPSKKAQ